MKYVLLRAAPEVPVTRTQSAEESLIRSGITAIKVATLSVENYSRDEAKDKMMTLLKSGVKFDAAISDNDSVALGTIDAMQLFGLDPRTVAITTINVIPQTAEAIRDEKILMSVFQNLRRQGSISVVVAANMLEEKPINEGIEYNILPDNPYSIFIPPDIVTKTHVPSDLYYIINENRFT
ncbi:hypothetical protein SDC9_181729 [bioreactor metagenome]|uniref:Periplasmic binding protein domain-containing protein n=1 Tax=bioreactor metagenome TaxID=1076179 RepID=A0A645H6V8_9ZZZZ